ncbi:hypothetical protein CMUS01_05514 [Colletotrichum musicola]|uniref:Uncharacterized protein n=1 Tax=Colletotrichum musicola TaxID=2175873 RepID=A0A8H6KR70_9PEZI|nr:hypothetical protein CMUS01_05514 [Colletotrichum musicola]
MATENFTTKPSAHGSGVVKLRMRC